MLPGIKMGAVHADIVPDQRQPVRPLFDFLHCGIVAIHQHDGDFPVLHLRLLPDNDHIALVERRLHTSPLDLQGEIGSALGHLGRDFFVVDDVGDGLDGDTRHHTAQDGNPVPPEPQDDEEPEADDKEE